MMAFLFAGCAFPGLIWSHKGIDGPLILGNKLAERLEKCDTGPSGISDVTYCKHAFVDHQGRKVDVVDDIQRRLDDFLALVPSIKPWVKVDQPPGSPRAPMSTRLPFRLHILTISPVVVLAVPRDASDTDYCSGRFFVQGCLPSRKLDTEPYWYKRPPKAVDGAFWFSPELGIAEKAVSRGVNTYEIELPGSVVKLTRTDSAWAVSRTQK